MTERFNGLAQPTPTRIMIPKEVYEAIIAGLCCLESTDNSMSGDATMESRMGLAWVEENMDYE